MGRVLGRSGEWGSMISFLTCLLVLFVIYKLYLIIIGTRGFAYRISRINNKISFPILGKKSDSRFSLLKKILLLNKKCNTINPASVMEMRTKFG